LGLRAALLVSEPVCFFLRLFWQALGPLCPLRLVGLHPLSVVAPYRYSDATSRLRCGHDGQAQCVLLAGSVRRASLQRERSLLTQAELAEAASMSRDQVSRIERDEVDPRFSTIRKLAKALGVDPQELTEQEG
jgi:DNA-binding XRE family transcriptional regulator